MTYLSAVDLNLLAPLAALLEERHVSRAAERIGVTQPAMSHALRRLRAELGDELLVRSSGGYVLTQRAERLNRQLLDLIPQLETLFADEEFDPSNRSERFRLAGTDYPAFVIGPSLAQRLFTASPRSTLRFSGWHDRVFDDLLHGGLDLAFFGSAPPPGLLTEELFEEQFICLMDKAHPLAGHTEPLTLDEYLQCAHVCVEITDGEQAVVDRHLRAINRPRQISLHVPYHLAAAAALPGTALVATLPTRLFAQSGPPSDLRVIAAPTEIKTMSFVMVWHPRLDDDIAQRWLRDLVRSTATGLIEDWTGVAGS